MRLTERARTKLLNKIDQLVETKFYDPNFKGHDWRGIVEKHRSNILAQEDSREFEGAVNTMLRELGSSGFGLISAATKISSKNAVSATFRAVETEYGSRWVFQDVHAGGPGAAAGVRPGDILIRIGDHEVISSEKPLFGMGQTLTLTIGATGGARTVQITTPGTKHKENPCAEPDPMKLEKIEGIPVVKVPLFPGKLGIDFARKLSALFDYEVNGADRLVLDLRGNPGGGLGGLRLMSLMVSGKKPVGFSVDRSAALRGYDQYKFPRFDRIPHSKFEVPKLALRFANKKSVVLVTEGFGSRGFHGRIAILVNEHTTCASEMVALFGREQASAKIIGTGTPGRLVSHTGIKLGYDFTLAIPVAAYQSWAGTRLDGVGLSPDQVVDWSYWDIRRGEDSQLRSAVRLVKSF